MSTRATAPLARLRVDFPILGRRVHDKRLVYLDSAATSQKPTVVLDAMDRYYRETNANVHRGVYTLAEEATAAYEGARAKAARFAGAARPREIVFTRSTTEAVNLVAAAYGRKHVSQGDEVLITGLEHHSNIVPWQLLCQEKGARLRYLSVSEQGELSLDELDEILAA
ncbi:MAG TPA: aminotransferase class V-fold PLP-dependent enzyme, partial [Acidimicrobiia bacterium]|nr:aminotransferase class V-fold PLP-dependent enzyme [Acidimicrobiia bacterium]